MSTRKAGKVAPKGVQVPAREARRGKLKALGGSTDDNCNNVLASQVSQALWLAKSDKAECAR